MTIDSVTSFHPVYRQAYIALTWLLLQDKNSMLVLKFCRDAGPT